MLKIWLLIGLFTAVLTFFFGSKEGLSRTQAWAVVLVNILFGPIIIAWAVWSILEEKCKKN